MPKLPQIKPRRIETALIKSGFVPRPAKGSHVVFTHPDGRRTVVPAHNRPVSTKPKHWPWQLGQISIFPL